MSFFQGKTALRIAYAELGVSDLSSASDKASAVSLVKLGKQSRLGMFLNGTSADIAVYAVHPEVADKTDRNNWLFAFEIPAKTSLNFDVSFATGLSIDVDTMFFVHRSTGTVQAGEKLRFIYWG